MQFNYDNPLLFIGLYPAFACGQFIINCLGHADQICPVGNDSFITDCLNGISRSEKHEYLIKSLPLRSDASWHQRFYNSVKWYSNVPRVLHSMDLEDYQLGTIFSGMTKEMRPYMDMRWRHHAKMVSHSGLGIIFPAHDQPELEGYFNILGARKYFSVTNYKSVRNLMINRKFPDEKKTAIWHDSHADYRCGGFIFDLENLINNDSSFITQMKEAYIYFDITGFDPKMLVNYKKQYLHSCINFRLT